MSITCYCDVCKRTLFNGVKHYEDFPNAEKITVRFETEQDEGRACKPYLSQVEMHICQHCKDKIVESGKYLSASGCQGYNNYYF